MRLMECSERRVVRVMHEGGRGLSIRTRRQHAGRHGFSPALRLTKAKKNRPEARLIVIDMSVSMGDGRARQTAGDHAVGRGPKLRAHEGLQVACDRAQAGVGELKIRRFRPTFNRTEVIEVRRLAVGAHQPEPRRGEA